MSTRHALTPSTLPMPDNPPKKNHTSTQHNADTQRSTYELSRRLIVEHFSSYPAQISFAIVCMLISAGAKAGLAWLMQPALDDVFISKDESQLWPIASVVIALALCLGASAYGSRVVLGIVGQKIIAQLQLSLHTHLMAADLEYHIRHASGALVSRVINDLETLRGALIECFIGLFRSILTAIALIGVMFYSNWFLSICVFIAFPLTLVAMSWISTFIRRHSVSVQSGTARLSALVTQSFQGISEIKLYGEEVAEINRAKGAIFDVLRASSRSIRIGSVLRPMTELLGGLGIAVIIFVGGGLVISGELSPGQLFSFLTALIMAYDPMKRLTGLYSQLQRGLAAADRVFEILDTRPKITDSPQAQPFPDGNLTFDRVSFAYGAPDRASIATSDEKPKPQTPTAIRALSFVIRQGEMTAIVGESGAGKSTLFSLLPRLYDVDEGEIRIGPCDIRNISLASLRQNMALVAQDAMIFDAPVLDNIRFGSANASHEQIISAAKAAAAHEFISELPDGYETRLGERGISLSGGQRQRLMIARALLRDPQIMLLDEATSALDSESERQIQRSFDGLKNETRILIVIAHRLSTIMHADRILVLDKGRLVESGSHTDLLKADGIYARLHRLQFGASSK